MAKVTLTLEDQPEGKVLMHVDSVPPFAKWDDSATPTPAQRVAATLAMLVQNLSDRKEMGDAAGEKR